MSFQQHKWTRWLVQRSQESWKLFWQGFRAPSRFQQTLVQEAQESRNRTALSVLRTQKEWNDMRYYGMAAYFRHKMPMPTLVGAESSWKSPFSTASSSSSSSTTTAASGADPSPSTTADASTTSSSAPSPPPAAKVAFMVTARMKGQLSELGYSAEDIKQMTPVEASLLIDNKVSPADRAARLPELVKDYEEEQERKQQESVDLLAAQQQQPEPVSSELSSSTPPPSSSTGGDRRADDPSRFQSPPRTPSSSGPSLGEQLLGSIASKNVIDTPVEIASRTHLPPPSNRVWFEVVEEYPASGDKPEVVALHSTEDEAEVDANLRHEIVTKRAQEEKKDVNVNYTVRKTTR